MMLGGSSQALRGGRPLCSPSLPAHPRGSCTNPVSSSLSSDRVACSISLLRTLYTAKQRKKQLAEGGAAAAHKLKQQQLQACGAQGGGARRSRAEKRADRTTRMLLAVLLLFLATEFPQVSKLLCC